MRNVGQSPLSKQFSSRGPRLAMLFCALLLTRCGGAGGGSATPAAGGGAGETSVQDGSAPVVINLIVPPRVAAQIVHVSSGGAKSPSRAPQYVSPSSLSMSVTVTSQRGGAPQTHLFPCTPTVCRASFRAPLGDDTIALTLSDGMNGGGNALSLTRATPVTIAAIDQNVVNLTANPVVARASVALGASATPSANVPGGSPADVPVTVLAYDADGNLIVGPGAYADTSGNPVSFAIALTNNRASGAGSVTITGATTFTSSGATPASAHYNGLWYDHADLTATSSNGAIPVVSGTLTSVPTAVTYTTGISPDSHPWEIAAGPDGALWFGENGQSAIGRITTSGSVTEYSAGISPGAGIYGVAAGPDGNMWFIEYIGRRVGRITPAGVVTEFTGMTAFQPVGIAPGPDGNMWFTEQLGNKVGEITPSGVITDFSSTGSHPRAVVTGPDGNIWVAYIGPALGGPTFVSRITSGPLFTDVPYSAPPGNIGYFFKMAVGADGNIWFPDTTSAYMCRYSFATNSVTVFSSGISFHAGIRSVTAGPDGNIWFTESDVGKVGRITPDGVVTEYGVSNGLDPSGFPIGIATGSDGNIWFTESNTNGVSKLIL